MADQVADALLAELNALTPSALRERLPDLFQAVEAADEATRPLVQSIAERAFAGEAGLAVLLHSAPLIARGLSHSDTGVRALTLVQVVRMAPSPVGLAELINHKLLEGIAVAVGDRDLTISQRASSFFIACAAGGPEQLALTLADTPTLAALRVLVVGSSSRSGSVIALRALALCVEMAATGDAQFELVAACGLLEPLLALWRGDDHLVRLNVAELFGTLGRTAAGLGWLGAEGTGVLAELCATLDVPVGDDPLLDLLRPAVVGCLGTLLEEGGARAAEALLGSEHGLVGKLWLLIRSREPEQLCSALATLRAAASSPIGYTAILTLQAAGGGGGAGGVSEETRLASLQRVADERARIGALAVTAQLVATYSEGAAGAAGAAGTAGLSPPPLSLEADATAVTGALEVGLRALVSACSPSPSTSAADAIGALVKSLSPDIRLVAMRLLGALAATEWGARELCASEGTLEVLTTSSDEHRLLSPLELREKHGIAKALIRWPQAPALLGTTATAALNAYVAAGPFAPQRPRAAIPAAPLTL